ncbi:drug/metabolite transporter (DMT)-like permease [Streptosporangium becharense]|uniref:Drug/metabolite transporter (DMT)-like permease n=1 Tax=Streptosporangium becharense TaxID=1816182 RepID=A0A7W9IE28_9ACTN|nr:DMT family transporter [Streptosporangium becharense]MBB2912259.1 drug/metabolite transporter (DMT)-like permease [Streptosporangium becharense]MBB5818806.1 drug/metabolite transporter (DMT)-like permease [Streptosporangium becharense]
MISPGGRTANPAGTAWRGTLLAGLGVLAFSGSFPATIFAMEGFDPYLVAFGRAVIAAVAAVAFLLVARAPLLPPRSQLRSYLAIGAGVALGFPLLSGVALDAGASAAHSAVVIGLLPAATAVCAVARAGERPRPLFWVACGLGAMSITIFTLGAGDGHITGADLLLVGALLSAAVGYTEGGRLARETPGWRVISYALVVVAPLTVPVTAVLALTTGMRPDAVSLAGFAYAGLVSMFLGFIPWYAGMAIGGIARAGQTQLVQPLLTLLWAWLLLGERFGPATVVAALVVLACVALTQRTRSAVPAGRLRSGTPERRVSSGTPT